jgi:hypothetical protein
LGHDGDNDAKYVLSDGRDAREVAKTLEAFADEVRHQPETGFERVAGTVLTAVWGVQGDAARGALAFKREFRNQLEGFTDDDKETLLRVTNERQWAKPRLPETMPELLERAQLRLKVDVTFGTEDHGRRLVSTLRAIFGAKQDTRDAATIAEAFVSRVQGLQTLENRDVDDAFSQARKDLLEGVPDHYRKKVVEKILEREEANLAAEGRKNELQEVVASRDERRARGWRAVLHEGHDASEKPRSR